MHYPPYIDIHSHRQGNPETITVNTLVLGDRNPSVPPLPFAVGIHPWDAERAQDEWWITASPIIEQAAAIGEIGLDYRRAIDRTLQQKWFIMQLNMAKERGLPVIIHCVKAWNDTIRCIEQSGCQQVICHGFTGSIQLAQELVRRGYFLSIGPRSLASDRTIHAIRTIGPEHLFLETDTAETDILDVYTRTAEMLGMEITDLRSLIYNNFTKIFGLWETGSNAQSSCSEKKN